jgi:hypothetical protein
MTLTDNLTTMTFSDSSSRVHFGALTMKKNLLIFGLYISLCTNAIAQPISEDYLYKKLTMERDSAQALESVLKTPDQYSARILYTSAGVAFKENHLEDSGFLYYAAQLRAEFDQVCFPATDKESSRPSILYGVISESIGNEVYPAITARPKVFAKVVSRLKSWTPKASNDYLPGYKFWERNTQKQAYDATKPKQTKFINRMSDLSVLLNDENYFTAFQIIQAYNRANNRQKPTREAVAKANEAMKRIEQDSRQKGVLSE